MALTFKRICRGAILETSQPHFEQLIPVDTDEPTTYAQRWDCGRTANDSVRAYLIGIANNYELHFYGYGATANYGQSSTSPYYSAPWASYTSQIKKVVYHDGITDIGQLNFYGKISSSSVYSSYQRIQLEVADTVRVMQRYAIHYAVCTSVSFGNGIRRIGEGIIAVSSDNQTVLFPESVQISFYAPIEGYTNTYSWLNAHTSSGGYFIVGDGVLLWGKPTGTAWNIPEGVKSVCCFPWDNRANVTSVTLPTTTKYLTMGAFATFSSLTKMILPQGTECIYGMAFQNCTSLTKIWIPRSLKHIITSGISTSTGAETDTWYPFTGCTNLTIYCEIDSSEIPEGWGEYWNYKASGSTVPVVWNYPEPTDW